MPKQYSDAQRRAKRNYFLRNRDKPEYKARRNQQRREYYRRKRSTPEGILELRAAANRYYHEVNKRDTVWVERQRKPNQERARKSRARLQEVRKQLQAVLGGQCKDCGLTDYRLLDFDHIDPLTKKMNISQRLSRPWNVLIVEAKKCELRCPNCHRLKTLAQGGFDARLRRYRNPPKNSTFV